MWWNRDRLVLPAQSRSSHEVRLASLLRSITTGGSCFFSLWVYRFVFLIVGQIIYENGIKIKAKKEKIYKINRGLNVVSCFCVVWWFFVNFPMSCIW